MTELCCTCHLPKQAPKTGSESAFRYICRLCLMRAEDTEPIFIHPGDSSLANKIFTCTGVRVEENAAVGPTSICMSCKTSVYKSYQFLELCQRNDKIIKNLLASQQAASESTSGNELRMVIRTGGGNQVPTVQRKRTNSRRKSTRSNYQDSTSASDVSWSENDDEKDDDGDDDADEDLPMRQLAYETDTQEDSPKRIRVDENKVPSLVISRARLNGAIRQSPSSEGSAGETSRTFTAEPTSPDNYFNCEFCDGSFPYSIQIRQHIDLYHADRKHELACKFCSKSFFTRAELNKHNSEKHASEGGVIECKLCKRFFTSPIGLHQHYRSIGHRANTGEAVYPRRRISCITQGYTSPARRPSVSSDYGSDYLSSGGGGVTRRKSTQSSHNVLEDFNPYDSSCYDEIATYKCDYCEDRFDDRQSLAQHTAVRPCRVELEPLNLDLLLERMDLDELLMPLHNTADVTIIEPPIEIVDLT